MAKHVFKPPTVAQERRRVASLGGGVFPAFTHEIALRCIRARLKGEWDNPALRSFGPLSPDVVADVLAMVEAAL